MTDGKKKDLPAMPFYWGDWFKAMDIQSLPRDTKCVWFEMLGRMWESNERGLLTLNGKPMSNFALAKILGFGDDVQEYLRHEKILEDAGIFSRREDGAIFSRFMVKMNEISQKRKEAGSKGGSKTQNFAQAKSEANAEYEIENEDEKEQEHITEKDFEVLWNKYPRKEGKKESQRHFNASVKTPEQLQQITKALENYNASERVREGKFVQKGATWFNNWQDWLAPSPEMMGKKDQKKVVSMRDITQTPEYQEQLRRANGNAN